MPKLQAACSVQVMKDGMVVRTDTPEVKAAQEGMMEFFLINHPLDCPICDQAGECGLQDYSFKHGLAFSRFRYEDKRTYPGRERIPLGPNVLLNMNRCIQCTRCVRFTHEISGTGELGFFERGSRAEIGNFPGKPLDNPLATNVVDICPVGALTSTRFRFAERVWYLDKKPSLCTGCDVGCNITLEHRRGKIRRYKPRFNPEVNDYWMCDYGRASFERYAGVERLTAPRLRRGDPARGHAGRLERGARPRPPRAASPGAAGAVALLGSGILSNEEAYLLAALADRLGTPAPGGGGRRRAGADDPQPPGRHLRPRGGAQPARRRAGRPSPATRPVPPRRREVRRRRRLAADLLDGDAAAHCAVLVVADSDFGPAAHDRRRWRGCAGPPSWWSSAGPTRRWPRPPTSPCRWPPTPRRRAPSSTSSGGCSTSPPPSRPPARCCPGWRCWPTSPPASTRRGRGRRRRGVRPAGGGDAGLRRPVAPHPAGHRRPAPSAGAPQTADEEVAA